VKMPGDNVGWPFENLRHVALHGMSLSCLSMAYLPFLQNKSTEISRNYFSDLPSNKEPKWMGTL